MNNYLIIWKDITGHVSLDFKSFKSEYALNKYIKDVDDCVDFIAWYNISTGDVERTKKKKLVPTILY